MVATVYEVCTLVGDWIQIGDACDAGHQDKVNSRPRGLHSLLSEYGSV